MDNQGRLHLTQQLCSVVSPHCRYQPQWLQEVIQTFQVYGTVVDCRLLSSSVTHSRGALVRMACVEEATAAMQVCPVTGVSEQEPFACQRLGVPSSFGCLSLTSPGCSCLF